MALGGFLVFCSMACLINSPSLIFPIRGWGSVPAVTPYLGLLAPWDIGAWLASLSAPPSQAVWRVGYICACWIRFLLSEDTCSRVSRFIWKLWRFIGLTSYWWPTVDWFSYSLNPIHSFTWDCNSSMAYRSWVHKSTDIWANKGSIFGILGAVQSMLALLFPCPLFQSLFHPVFWLLFLLLR